MKFGIIGAGPIGASISRKLVKQGHAVKIADARDIKHLEGKDIAGKPVTINEVIDDIDVLLLSLPLHVMSSLRHIIDQVSDDVVIADTSNYYPFRDDYIEDIENGMVESVWVSKQIGRPIVKALNNQLAYTLDSKGTPEGTAGRIAMAIFGEHATQKQVMIDVVNDLGFDAVDGGALSDSWKSQPGTPAYCTELTKVELIEALNNADQERAPILRDKVMAKFSAGMTHEDIVRINRETYNS